MPNGLRRDNSIHAFVWKVPDDVIRLADALNAMAAQLDDRIHICYSSAQ